MPEQALDDSVASCRMSRTTWTAPHVLSGDRREIRDRKAGLVSYYVDGPGLPSKTAGSAQPPPLLLVHSINAAGSAHEVKPLFDAYKHQRRTYAIDLPGYGHSERSDRTYDQRLMVDAIHAVVAEICSDNQVDAIDALAVSLSCEFLGKVAVETPEAIRSLAFVSPTGFARITKTHGPPEADCRRPNLYRKLSLPLVGKTLFRLLTVPPSIRFFLQKTWGSKHIDEEMFRHCCRVSRYPDAHRAPLHFVAGYLFSADIPTVFNALAHPVWLSHGVRGDFTDFSRTDNFADKPNWRITVMDTGAMPYFEITETFIEAYEDFLAQVSSGQAVNPSSSACSFEAP